MVIVKNGRNVNWMWVPSKVARVFSENGNSGVEWYFEVQVYLRVQSAVKNLFYQMSK